MSGEPLSELLSANTIIIHPGSLYLRIGRASDTKPAKILHAIARKRKSGGGSYKDSLLVPKTKLDAAAQDSWDHSTHQVFEALRQVSRKDGTKRQPPTLEEVRQLNAGSGPAGDTGNGTAEVADGEEEVVVGDKVLHLPPALEYNVHFPFRRGDLNLHPGIGGSLSSILIDLQEVWGRSIEAELGVAPCDLHLYQAVLVIPTLGRRAAVKHLVSLLLLGLGFGGCFVVQDHVAATFGAGLAAACVVDVGDQSVSVSCVEDGVSQPSTRLQLGYGGSDVAQLLGQLLARAGGRQLDQLQLLGMKEAVCHLELDRSGVVTYQGRHLGDECLVAPLGLFQPALLAVTGPKAVVVAGRDPGDAEDPHDHLYLRDTSRKYTKTGDMADAGSGHQGGDTEFEDQDLEAVAGPDTSSGLRDTPLALDQAILRSVEMCPSEESRRKMAGAVLVVGGGLALPGAAGYLQSRLARLANTTPGWQSWCEVQVVTGPGGGHDTGSVAWRGAAVMAGLETAQELWISPREWRRHGQKLLRERAPFPWA